MELFTVGDFKVFDIPEFRERMAAIVSRIRPKLTSIGAELVPKVSALVDRPLYVHVAKHARRTVNPPDDTWAAMAASPRGYKADVHFKVAVSRHCVRFLFEAGPEYYAKQAWLKAWRRQFKDIGAGLRGLEWFRNEHDEEPVVFADLKQAADELTRRKDGQFVLGRRIDAAEFSKMKPRQVEKAALETFGAAAPLFGIYKQRSG